MKKLYLLICILFVNYNAHSQNYELGIVHVSNYDFKIVAIPDFDSAGNTDVSDVGFTLVLPTGDADIANHASLIPSRVWSVDQFDAEFLTNFNPSLGDGTKDVFQFNMPPGQTILSHTSGEQIDLVSFSITNSPTSGSIYFLLNSDPIAIGASSVLDSFYNVDLDGPGNNPTADYFSTPAPSLDNFMFSTLTVENVVLEDNSITIYPNPTSDYINVATNHKVLNIEIFDILGKKVKQVSSTKYIDVNNLQTGIYILKVFTDKGQITKKIVIE